jgi:hypothetical protein
MRQQLKMDLEEVKQELMRQEALAAEAHATAPMAEQELRYWRQRVTELEPGAPNFTCFTTTSTTVHYWRQRVTELEPGAPNFTCVTTTSTTVHYWRQRVTELEPGAPDFTCFTRRRSASSTRIRSPIVLLSACGRRKSTVPLRIVSVLKAA